MSNELPKTSQQDIDRANANILEVVGEFIDLKKQGAEWVACCPFHNEKSPSFKVNQNKMMYYCFGCGASGDAVSFVMEFKGFNFPDSVRYINGEPTKANIVRPPADQRPSFAQQRQQARQFELIIPVPDHAEPPPSVHSRHGKLTSMWPIRMPDGEHIYGYVVRFDILRRDPETGEMRPGKEVLPLTYSVDTETGEEGWRWAALPKPRPIYGLEQLATPGMVVMVEGEKTVDAARRLLPQFQVISYLGGGKAIEHTDWLPLKGRKVLIIRDADQEGYVTTYGRLGEDGELERRGLVHILLEQGCIVKCSEPPADYPRGWDLADAETDGWTPDDVLAWVKKHMTDPLPPSPPKKKASVDNEQVPEPDAHDEMMADRFADEEDGEQEVMLDQSDLPPQPKSTAGIDGHNQPWDFLGYDRDYYFIYHHGKKQILTLTVGSFGKNGLITLAPLNWWEKSDFMANKKKPEIDTDAALDWIVQACIAKGVFDPSCVRGRGAWEDEERLVFHLGDRLWVDGKITNLEEINSKFVYERKFRMPTLPETALTTAEGQHILEICRKFRWSMPASGALLAGWMALAPICGALAWRPHIWVTGGAGSGKSTIMEFLHWLMNGMDKYAQGNSSEAGIRQKLAGDAIPVLFDESESNTEKDANRMQSVLSLIRQSSSDSAAETFKGTQFGNAVSYHVRSMFCLSSIQVALTQQADVERLSVLRLRPKRDKAPKASKADEWIKLRDSIYALQTDKTVPGRLFLRSLKLIPIIRVNIELFSHVCTKRFGTRREGDQYGALLAGCWSLVSNELVTEQQAEELVNTFNWDEFTENSETEESEKALSALMEAHLRIGNLTLTVFEVITMASNAVQGGNPPLTTDEAGRVLRRYGMAIRGADLLLANTSMALQHLMENTPFGADLRGQLRRLPGAASNDNKTVKFNGVGSKVMSLPLELIISDYQPRLVADDSPI